MVRIEMDESDGPVLEKTPMVEYVAQKATWMVVYGNKTFADPGTAKMGWFDDGELMFAVHMPPETVRALRDTLNNVDAWMKEDGL